MRPTRAQGARASFTVGLIVALIVGLAAAAPSEGKDCQSDTMLPSDVRVTIPGADVPPSAARFSGTWSGLWKDKDRDDGLCRTLVVEAGSGRLLGVGAGRRSSSEVTGERKHTKPSCPLQVLAAHE